MFPLTSEVSLFLKFGLLGMATEHVCIYFIRMYVYLGGGYFSDLLFILPIMLIPLGVIVVTGAATEIIIRKRYALVNDMDMKIRVPIYALSLLFVTLIGPLIGFSLDYFIPKSISGYGFILGLIILSLLVFIISIYISRKLIQSHTTFGKLIKGYLPLSFPLMVLLHYLLYYNIHWKIEAIRKDDLMLINHSGYCVGFPFPSEGLFWQGNTGEFSINTIYLTLNLISYFLCGFALYYLILRKIEFKSIISKVLTYSGYLISLCYFTMIALHYFPDGDPDVGWTVPFKVAGLYYKWGGIHIYIF